MEDSRLLSKLLQVVVGPQWDVTKEDVDALCEIGLLQKEEDGGLHGFSREFEEHLEVVSRNVDIWPLWRDTERAIRDFLENNLMTKFGTEWPIRLTQARPNLGKVIGECQNKQDKERQKKERRLYSGEISPLLYYSYPMDLFQIMAADWMSLGEPLLGRDKKGWHEKFSVLAKVRTPLAHNRMESVGDGERKQAEGICQQILELYSDYTGSTSVKAV